MPVRNSSAPNSELWLRGGARAAALAFVLAGLVGGSAQASGDQPGDGPRVTIGISENGVFQEGNTFPFPSRVTAFGSGFAPNQPISVSGAVMGRAYAGSGADEAFTDQHGSFPPDTYFTIPSRYGQTGRTLYPWAITVGSDTVAVPLRTLYHSAPGLLTPTVRPGGRVAYELASYVGVGGRGQKVAVDLSGTPLGCGTASDDGWLASSVVLPEATPEGQAEMGFSAGSSCTPGGTTDLPSSDRTLRPTVDDSAPVATAAATADPGGSLSVSGEGFPAGADLDVVFDVTMRGPWTFNTYASPFQPDATLTAAPDGTVQGNVPVPASMTPGEHLLVITTGDGQDGYHAPGETTAAAAFTANAVASAPPAPAPVITTPSAPAPLQLVPPLASPPSASTAPVGPRSGPSTARNVKPMGVKVSGAKLTVTLGGSPIRGTKVSVRSARNLRLSRTSKASRITFATLRTNGRTKATTKLTSRGRKALARYRKVDVVITVATPGTKTRATKTATLRTGRR